jgi:hypothetical protein
MLKKTAPHAFLCALAIVASSYPASGVDSEVTKLAAEIRDQGWIVFSARSEKGDWDLFIMRSDGSQRHSLTQTFDFNEVVSAFFA